MDLLTVLSYINKISLLIFFVIAVILGYQIYLFKKDLTLKKNEENLNIPDFDESLKIETGNYTQLPAYLLESIKKPIYKDNQKSIANIIIASVLLVFTMLVFLIVKNKTDSLSKSQIKLTLPTPTITSKIIAINNSPTLEPSVSPTDYITPTEITPTPTDITPTEITPTEIILASPTEPSQSAKQPTTEITITPTQISSLPITGVTDKAVVLFTAAISFILLAFTL